MTNKDIDKLLVAFDKQVFKDLDKLVGTGIDADNFGGNQCVDVIKWYINRIWGKPYSFGGAAYKILTNKDWFTACCTVAEHKGMGITPYYKGTILVYGKTKNNPYGHVALCANTTADYEDLKVYEQNGFHPNGVLMKHRPMLSESNLIGSMRIIANTLPVYKEAVSKRDAEEAHKNLAAKPQDIATGELPNNKPLNITMKTKADSQPARQHPKKVLSSVGKSSTKYVLPTSVILGALYKIYPDIATDPHTISLVTAGVGIGWAQLIKVLEGLLKVDLNQDNKIG